MIAMKQQTPSTTANIQVGVDIGGSKIAILVVDANQNELATQTFATDVTSKENTLVCIVKAIQSTLETANCSIEMVEGIGIGLPGKVDPTNGHVEFAVNLNWDFYPAGQLLQEKLGTPCYLENDVRLAALGVQYSAYPEIENLIYITVGTGVAAGVILNNQLFRGSHGIAGEFGHMVIDPHGPICNCGNQGCLETFVAGPAYTRAAMQVNEGLLAEMRRDDEITAVSVFEAAKKKDRHAQTIIDQAGAVLGRGLQNLITVYDPDKIIIGGGVSHAGAPFLKSILQEWQRQKDMSPFAANLLNEALLELAPVNRNFGTWGGIALVKLHAAQVYNN